MKRVFLTIGIMLITVLVIWYGVKPYLEKHSPPVVITTIKTATVLKPKLYLPDFSLLNTENETFTKQSLLNHWTLLFFGYTHCPGICPKTLGVVNQFWQTMPDNIQFVFASLDPNVDTPDTLKTFLKRFNPNFRGLTGSAEMIQTLSKACGIYSFTEKNQNPHNNLKQIDHSGSLLLINPQGELSAVFSPPHDAALIMKDLNEILSLSRSHP